MPSRVSRFMPQATQSDEPNSRVGRFMPKPPPVPTNQNSRLTVEQFRERAQSPTAAFFGADPNVRQRNVEDFDVPRGIDYGLNAIQRGMLSADQAAAMRESRIAQPSVPDFTPTEKIVRAWKEGDPVGMVKNIPGVLGQAVRGGRTAPSFIKAEQMLQEDRFRPSKGFEEFNRGDLSQLAKNPLIAGEMVLESLPSMVQSQATAIPQNVALYGTAGAITGAPAAGIGAGPGAAVGSAFGAIKGTGEASYKGEFEASILDQLRQIKGLDMTDPKAVTAVLRDDSIMGPIRQRADAKAKRIQFWDTLSAGLGGNVASLARGAGKSALRRSLAEAADLGVQAGTGSIGELHGQIAAGEKRNAPAIVSEGAAEIAQTAAASVLNRMLGGRGVISSPAKASRNAVEARAAEKMTQYRAKPVEAAPEAPQAPAAVDAVAARAADPNTPLEELVPLLEDPNLSEEAFLAVANRFAQAEAETTTPEGQRAIGANVPPPRLSMDAPRKQLGYEPTEQAPLSPPSPITTIPAPPVEEAPS